MAENSDHDRRKVGKRSIVEILNWMQFEADRDYKGDLLENALTVFNRLPPRDKRMFLRAGLMQLWDLQIDLAEQGVGEILIDNHFRIVPKEVEAERFEITAKAREVSIAKRRTMGWKWWLGFLSIMGTVILYFIVDFMETPYGAMFTRKAWRVLSLLGW